MDKSVSILIGDVEETLHEPECNLDGANCEMANGTFNVVRFEGNSRESVTGNRDDHTEVRSHLAREGTSERWPVSDRSV